MYLLETVADDEYSMDGILDDDIEEVLDDLLSYGTDVSEWRRNYKNAICHYEDPFKAVLEHNEDIVLKTCVELYIRRKIIL